MYKEIATKQLKNRNTKQCNLRTKVIIIIIPLHTKNNNNNPKGAI
jgi:hypothetical protein